MSCDVTCSIDGWHGDTCYTYYVGDNPLQSMSTELAMFLCIGQQSREIGISVLSPHGQTYDSGVIIEKYIQSMDRVRNIKKQPNSVWVLKDYTGHGKTLFFLL